MKTRTQFTHRVDMWDDAGQTIIEHLAGVEDFDPAASTSAPDSGSSPRKSTMSSERHWSGKRGSSIWGNNRGSELLADIQRSGAGPR
jgi:hypothetical protein